MPKTGKGENGKRKKEKEGDSGEEANGKWQCISTATK